MNKVHKKEVAKNYGKTSALKLLKEMLDQILEKNHSYYESWEILIEVLGQYLGIIDQPWLYSEPSNDVEEYEDKLNPLHRSAYRVRFPEYDPLRELLGLPPKLTKPVIEEPDPSRPQYPIWLTKNMKTRIKNRPRHYSSRTSREAQPFLIQFTNTGILESYVRNACAEADLGGSENICAGVDHLGAIFEEFGLADRKNRLGQMLTPVNVVKFMVQINFGDSPVTKIETVLDPALGTGRFLIYASISFPYKPMILCGIEIDLTLYRVALVNMALYSNHPYSILCADTLAMINQPWELGNLWEPPDMLQFYLKPKPPPQPFSLKAFTEMQQAEAQT